MRIRRSNGPPTMRASPSREPRITWNCTGSGDSRRRLLRGSEDTRYASARPCRIALVAAHAAPPAAVLFQGLRRDRVEELLDGERLLDERFDRRVRRQAPTVERRAHHDDRRVASLIRPALQELDAIDLRHEEVEHDDVGPELAAALETLRSVARRGDRVSGLGQHRDDHVADGSVVLDDEDLLHAGHQGSVPSCSRSEWWIEDSGCGVISAQLCGSSAWPAAQYAHSPDCSVTCPDPSGFVGPIA